MNSPATRPLVVFVALALVWGSSFLLIRVLANAGVEALGVSGGRCLLGFLSLAPFALAPQARKLWPRDRRTLAIIGLMGIVNFATPWTLFGVAAHHVPSGLGAVTNASTPLWAAIFTTVIIKDTRLSGRAVAGLCAGFAGVLLLMERRVDGLDRDAFLGVPAMLAATACYGVSVAVIRRWLHHVHPLPLTFGQVGVATTILFPSALLTGAYEGVDWRWQETLSMLVLGGIGSGIASMAYMWLISTLGPVRAASITYLMPPVGIALGWLLLDESVAWSMLVGVGFIFAGIALVQGRIPSMARVRRRQPALAQPGADP